MYIPSLDKELSLTEALDCLIEEYGNVKIVGDKLRVSETTILNWRSGGSVPNIVDEKKIKELIDLINIQKQRGIGRKGNRGPGT